MAKVEVCVIATRDAESLHKKHFQVRHAHSTGFIQSAVPQRTIKSLQRLIKVLINHNCNCKS